ncbi:MAG TPA: family 16 glycosylhydrolase, partial [Cytophagaceae bacterium]|nr:family 16 glycosylhydrolase [Cytophagaceae bacterium]
MLSYLDKILNSIPATKKFILPVIFVLFTIAEGFSQCSQLVWSDEFNGSTLDLTKWQYQVGDGSAYGLSGGWGNSELEYYTSGTQNVNVTGGNLELIALYQPNYNGTGYNYTSGRIRSTNTATNNPRNEWTYGSFEARIKVPTPYNDSRAWPGFWMLPHNGPWPNTGEIDIMETGNNGNPWYYNGTLHYGSSYPGFYAGTGGQTINTSTSCPAAPVGDLSVCFHLYRVDWAPNSIKFFVDGVQVGATMTNATVGSGGTIGALWPFDPASNPYHMILNMAVGGNFPGSAMNNARFPLKMLVDYVRVYSTPAAVSITGKTKVIQGQTGFVYAVPLVAGNTYSWTVPTGATITAGQSTEQITVNYGSTAVSGNVSVTITPSAGGCVAATSNLAISVLVNGCSLTLEDFETSSPPTRNLGYNFSTGWMNRANTTSPSFPFGTFANPSATGINTSPNVCKYERNGGVQYDVLAYNDIAIGDASNFRNGISTFNMDVYSAVASGTQIIVQLEAKDKAQTGWPNGVYARFAATTGTANTWNRLQFTLLDTPDAAMLPTEVDQIVLFFAPNGYTSGIFYWDNFKRVGITPVTTAIAGPATVCTNNQGVIYTATGLAGSKFAWTVPAGATIVSGQNTNTLTVNFGTTGGNITATETSVVNCTGAAKTFAVAVSGTCVLATDFSATPLSTCTGKTVTFTDLTSGKTGGETYSWDFGAGASLPAGTTGAGPFAVTYSTGGLKTATVTVTKGTSSTKTKTNYITIAAPPTGCIFSDDFNDNTVNYIAPIPGAFTHTEAGTVWTVSNAGYSEWQNWTYDINNGVTASPINFSCSGNAPVFKIIAKASANCFLRIMMMDANGLTTDNMTSYNLELTTTYQTFTIDYSTHFRNYYGGTPGPLDSTQISKLMFFINPGYTTYPYVGANGTYNTAFGGTVNIDWMGIGNSCNQPLSPTITFNNQTATY